MTNNTESPDQSSDTQAMVKRRSVLTRASKYMADITKELVDMNTATDPILKDAVALHPLGETVDLVADFDAAVTNLENAVKELKKSLAYVKEVSMPERMDKEQTKTFNTDKYRVTRTGRIFASIVAAKVEEAYAWLRKNDYGSLIKETVNSSSLSSAAKEVMENGKELPDDIFVCHVKDGISITKKKG